MLEIQKYLRAGNSPESLTSLLGIKICQHKTVPNLIGFSYDQIESPKAHPIVLESRGLILDSANDWNVVCMPFTRFFNIEEGNAASVDWNTAKAYEKLDGTLCSLYWYEDKWYVATRNVPDASGPIPTGVGVEQTTFAQLFWEIWYEMGYASIYEANPEIKNYCFMFELTSPYNEIVVKHKTSKITLLGCRKLETLQEIHLDVIPAFIRRKHILTNDIFCDKCGLQITTLRPYLRQGCMKKPIQFECVRSFALNNLQEILNSFQTMNPTEQEGYVVCDANFNRAKVKSPAYVVLHHIAGNGVLSNARAVDIIRAGELDEVCGIFPKFADALHKGRSALEKMIADGEALYALHSGLAVQKDFALAIKSSPIAGALFGVRNKKFLSVRASVYAMNSERLAELIF